MFGFWDLYAAVYDSLPKYFRPYQVLMEQVTEEAGKYIKTGKILDAGCGTGNFSIALAEKGYNVVGIDYTEGMLKRARVKIREAAINNVELYNLDLEEKLDFPDACFDVIVSIHALYTMKNPERSIEEYHRLLRRDGYFILSEIQRPIKLMPIINEAKDRGGWREALSIFYHLFLLGIFNIALSKKQGAGSYHYWSEKEIREKLSSVGFKVISVYEAYTNNQDLLVTSVKE